MNPEPEIPEHWQRLIEAAVQARELAYAPYSNFLVGASVLSSSGAIFRGCNVENASYGLTICAERVAISAGVTAGFQSFTALAVATAEGSPPCGACRQVLAEFASDLEILLVATDHRSRVEPVRLQMLLPRRFRKSGAQQ